MDPRVIYRHEIKKILDYIRRIPNKDDPRCRRAYERIHEYQNAIWEYTNELRVH